MNDQELAMLQDELAEARAEIEVVRTSAAGSEARAAQLEERLGEAIERERALTEQALAAVARYRALAIEHSPELPEGLVTGDTIEEVDAALERARGTVARVRGHIESQAQASRVPAGAPERSSPDLSSLSAEEKIRMGLNTER
jgi:hypothetical protein